MRKHCVFARETLPYASSGITETLGKITRYHKICTAGVIRAKYSANNKYGAICQKINSVSVTVAII